MGLGKESVKMSRKNKKGISPYLSGNQPEKRFIQVGNLFLHHHAVRDLGHAAFLLYIMISMEAGGKSETVFSHGTAKKYGMSYSTYDRAVKELIEAGFVTRIYPADQSRYSKAKYRFCLDWKMPNPFGLPASAS